MIDFVQAQIPKENALAELMQCEAEEKPSEKIFRFLNNVIESETSIGNNQIGKPSGLYKKQQLQFEESS
ncbi:MAG: hypothetical protein ACPGGD_06895, partial [Thalassolituus sp.]